MENELRYSGFSGCPHPEKTVYLTYETALHRAEVLGEKFNKEYWVYKCGGCKMWHLSTSSHRLKTSELTPERKRRRRQNWKRNKRARKQAAREAKKEE